MLRKFLWCKHVLLIFFSVLQLVLTEFDLVVCLFCFFQSIILPVYNAERWLDDCLRSILEQNVGKLSVQVSIFNDGSTDNSPNLINKWKPVMEDNGMQVCVRQHSGPPKGGDEQWFG